MQIDMLTKEAALNDAGAYTRIAGKSLQKLDNPMTANAATGIHLNMASAN
jgi:hypothetical protein